MVSPQIQVPSDIPQPLIEIADGDRDNRPALRIVATFASSMLPGAGQWVLKASVNAVLLNLAFVGLAVGVWYGRLPSTDTGFVAAVVGGWILFCVSAWDALRNSRGVARPGSLIWLAVFLPIAVLVSTAFTNADMRASGFQSYVIPSGSMEHTLDVGDRLIVDTTYFKDHVVHGGDVIVFRKGEQQYCKRVIATGGSQVEGINGVIYIGGEPLKEPYVQHLGNAPDELNNFAPVVVPSGQLFVMGDNRDQSFDSRSPDFGFAPESGVIGKPLFIYYSKRTERNGRQIE